MTKAEKRKWIMRASERAADRARQKYIYDIARATRSYNRLMATIDKMTGDALARLKGGRQ